jgi:uncharacterized protein YjiS (DUF1127 family)
MTTGRIHGLLPFGVTGIGRPDHRHDEHDLGPSTFTFLFRLILRSLQTRRERMAMASLSDHLLRDIGLSRSTAVWDSEIRNRLP